MKKTIAFSVCLAIASSAFAGVDGQKAAYRGGTVMGLEQGKEAKLDVSGPDALMFQTKQFTLTVPYQKIQSIEYGQKAGRRVGLAMAVGVVALFSKKRNHMLTLSWMNAEGKTDAAVFEVGKDVIRVALSILEAKSGKQVEYESPEAKANIGK